MDILVDAMEKLKCSSCDQDEEVCGHRQYVCPVLGPSRCDWLGPRFTMLVHCSAHHPDNVLENPCSLSHDIATSNEHNYIIPVFHVLFLLQTKVCVATGKIFHAVRLLGSSAEPNFFFTLDIKRGDEQVTKKGQVAAQGCLAIQESTSLALNINSLLDVLGGLDGTTFTVTVKQRVVVNCADCAEEVTVFGYLSQYGWWCEDCSPQRRECENQAQGCHHSDFDIKCTKHERLFCQQRTECYICDVAVSRGSLSEHYGTAHQDITHLAGSTWQVTRGVGWSIVSSFAGIVVCEYEIFNSQLSFWVYIPVPNLHLSEYRCKVRFTDPATGHTRTFTPDTRYSDWYDWEIEITKADFPSWNVVFDVCLYITKM